MAKLMQELNFSQHEVDQFHQIFQSWLERDEAGRGSCGSSTSKIASAGSNTCAPCGLSHDIVKRIVRTLGVSMTRENAGKLEEKLANLGELLDFPGFLQLMRWLMDTDFAGINSAVAKKL